MSWFSVTPAEPLVLHSIATSCTNGADSQPFTLMRFATKYNDKQVKAPNVLPIVLPIWQHF